MNLCLSEHGYLFLKKMWKMWYILDISTIWNCKKKSSTEIFLYVHALKNFLFLLKNEWVCSELLFCYIAKTDGLGIWLSYCCSNNRERPFNNRERPFNNRERPLLTVAYSCWFPWVCNSGSCQQSRKKMVQASFHQASKFTHCAADVFFI